MAVRASGRFIEKFGSAIFPPSGLESPSDNSDSRRVVILALHLTTDCEDSEVWTLASGTLPSEYCVDRQLLRWQIIYCSYNHAKKYPLTSSETWTQEDMASTVTIATAIILWCCQRPPSVKKLGAAI